jgi:hypothetical protein
MAGSSIHLGVALMRSESLQVPLLQHYILFHGESSARRVSLFIVTINHHRKIPGLNIPADAITRRPNIFLSALSDENALKQFLEALEWMIQEVKKS